MRAHRSFSQRRPLPPTFVASCRILSKRIEGRMSALASGYRPASRCPSLTTRGIDENLDRLADCCRSLLPFVGASRGWGVAEDSTRVAVDAVLLDAPRNASPS